MDVAKALRFSLVVPVLLSLTACGNDLYGSSQPTNDKPTPQCASSAIPGQYIIRWKNGKHSVERASSSESLQRNLVAAKADQIDFIEPDYRMHIHGMRSQSTRETTGPVAAVNNWGQQKVSADQAWPIAKGDGVIVAVVDAGIDVNHAQLRNQIAYNTGEIPNNSVDDDKNGLIDDFAGFDFGAGSGNVHDAPNSTHHGSHVSGIILAEHMSDGSGIKGMAPGAKLLPLVFMDDTGSGATSDAISAMEYAVSRGAKIISASWGSEGSCSSALKAAIAGLEAKGVLFVAAAGNGNRAGIGYNLDYTKTYPAAYPLSGQITVGAIDEGGVMTGFSNYSRNLVHLMAPGLDIWSTVYDDGQSPNHGYEKMDGTSMATPFVSGAAAVLWSYRPKATVRQIKAALLASVNPGNYVVVSSGALNLRAALDELARTVAP